jgi:Na+-transporting methylmalonyl-CoA/oxaloacetate decarboxylase gamma subunit
MALEDILVWVLRAFGALYIFGAVMLFRHLRVYALVDDATQRIEMMTREFEGEETPPPDHADKSRNGWLAAGGVLTAIAGLAMVFALRISLVLLILVVIHQIAYFIRQRHVEMNAKTPEDALEARPTQATRNGFYTCLGLLVLAAYLEWKGALV